MMIRLDPTTVEEIRTKYPQRWVVLADPKCDGQGVVKSGIVLAVGSEQQEVYSKVKSNAFGELVYWHTSKEVPRSR